jgi:hypothetical protein
MLLEYILSLLHKQIPSAILSIQWNLCWSQVLCSGDFTQNLSYYNGISTIRITYNSLIAAISFLQIFSAMELINAEAPEIAYLRTQNLC